MTEREDELAWRERVVDEKEHELNRILARNESKALIAPRSARLREFLSDPVPVIWAVGAS